MTGVIAEKSHLYYARITELSLLVMAIIALFVNFFVFESLIVPGNAAATVENLLANDLLFRFGIAGFIIVLLLDVVVSWSLYILLRQVNKNLALLAALFRLAYTAIFAAALFNFISVLQLIRGEMYSAALETSQLQVQVMLMVDAFNNGWLVGLIFIGFHLLLIGYLVFKSKFMPRIIGIVVMLAGLGYLIDNFAQVLLSNYADYEIIFLLIVAVPGVIGELALALWLLFKGKEIPEIIPLKPSLEGGVS
ncbi:DUF4386 domain-containing protein [Planomicrobium sp. MB-3u-38]|uniref:DUF4386 domain-containing protein n=1 Tax=Planomicrobium sp. MB-3u-38 TaxID=2058318 RepID=UPI000C7B3975|nr:DUF4386 domain-containing protein [Planomicrobium sp. MB-3u-38]PKH08544.1 DUF4386 domain-containing protein [Planomicrobium sp. MB-3u-38]